LLAACGGGGGGGSSSSGPPPDPDAILPSAAFAAQCAAPRAGIDPDTGSLYADRQGSATEEKRWVRAWIDETYLWFDEVPGDLKAADYATPVTYFADLKTPARTASGRPKDRFHFTMDTAQYRRQTQGGLLVGYGMEVAVLQSSPPRDLRVAYVTPGGSAAANGVQRGERVLAIDGIDVANGSNVDALNAGLAPAQAGETHAFTLGRADGSGSRQANLVATVVADTPVLNVKTLPGTRGPIGYLQFNDHSEAAEAQLITAIQQLKNAGIVDLVLDMRYNGGGVLAIASELASMVGAPAATRGQVFERLQSNRKNPFRLTDAQATMPFFDNAVGYSAPVGASLPQLGLSRVTVLTGPDTCSASESVINGLRGVGVTVDLVGGTTCGKPYAFFPKDNCGTTYFAIQLQGVNAQGFGDYGDGFAPNCAVADDFGHALGDPAEARLAAALTLRAGGSCPAVVVASASSQKAQATVVEAPYLRRAPWRENRRVDTR